MNKFLLKILFLLVVIIIITLLIRKYQGLILYQNGTLFDKNLLNNPKKYRSPNEQNLNYNDLYIKTLDGILLHGWLIKTKDSQNKPTIIYFHENAGNIGFRMDLIKNYIEIVDVNFVIIAYRGYTYSQGEPSELGLKIDSISIIQNILKRKDEIDVNNVFIHGSSLGGAVAIFSLYNKNYLNSLNKIHDLPLIKGVIIQNTFTSISDMVNNIYPILKYLKFILLSNYWNSLDQIKEIEIPILFLSSRKDEIVPCKMMDILFESSASKNKEIVHFINSSHNILSQSDRKLFYKKIKEFINNN